MQKTQALRKPQAQMEEDECPICKESLPRGKDDDTTAGEAHIASCIETHLTSANNHTHNHPPPKKPLPATQSLRREDNECPVCYTSLLSKEFDGNEAAREKHIATCLESKSFSSASQPQYAPPAYERPANLLGSKAGRDRKDGTMLAASPLATSNVELASGLNKDTTLQKQEDRIFNLQSRSLLQY